MHPVDAAEVGAADADADVDAVVQSVVVSFPVAASNPFDYCF